MGAVRRFICPSCQKVWDIRTGHGLNHALLKNVLPAFPEEIQRQIAADTENEEFPFFSFGYQAASCRQCQKITAIPVIDLKQSRKKYVSGCPDCGNMVSVSAEDVLICPICTKTHLKVYETGHWD